MTSNNNKNNSKRWGDLSLLKYFNRRWREQQRQQPQPSAVERWVATLPVANAEECARQLRPAVEELGRVEREPAERLAALEAMRPVLHTTLRGLERQFLAKPLALSAEQQRSFNLCDKLNRHLRDAYALAASQAAERLQQARDAAGASDIPVASANPYEDAPLPAANTEAAEPDEDEPYEAELALALHRALTEQGALLLRRYQSYGEPVSGQWQALHQLFMTAAKYQCLNSEVQDSVYGDCSVQHAYLRPLLLAAARPQELRQRDMSRLFEHFARWNGCVGTASAGNADWLFKLSEDRPPRRRDANTANPSTSTSGCIGIDTRGLDTRLRDEQRESDGEDSGLYPWLLEKLRRAWCEPSQPAPAIAPSQEPLRLALGLFAGHYFAAGQHAFNAFLEEDKQPLLQAKAANGEDGADSKDVWAKSGSTDARYKEVTPGRFAHQVFEFHTPLAQYNKDGAAANFSSYPVLSVAASAHSRCLRWRNANPVHPKVGNLICLNHPGEAQSSLGVLRWIKNRGGEFSNIGIDLLGNNAQAFSARLLKAGLPQGQFQRVFLLPADSEGGDRPSTLVAANGKFAAGQVLRLYRPGQALRVQLTHCLEEAGTVSVYRYEVRGVEDLARPKNNANSAAASQLNQPAPENA